MNRPSAIPRQRPIAPLIPSRQSRFWPPNRGRRTRFQGALQKEVPSSVSSTESPGTWHRGKSGDMAPCQERRERRKSGDMARCREQEAGGQGKPGDKKGMAEEGTGTEHWGRWDVRAWPFGWTLQTQPLSHSTQSRSGSANAADVGVFARARFDLRLRSARSNRVADCPQGRSTGRGSASRSCQSNERKPSTRIG